MLALPKESRACSNDDNAVIPLNVIPPDYVNIITVTILYRPMRTFV